MIRRFLIKNGMESQVHHRKLFAHGFTFVMYCASLIVFYYYLAIYMTYTDPQHSRDALIAWIVTTYTNFAVQIAMIVFFLQLKTNYSKEPSQHMSTEPKDDVSV